MSSSLRASTPLLEENFDVQMVTIEESRIKPISDAAYDENFDKTFGKDDTIEQNSFSLDEIESDGYESDISIDFVQEREITTLINSNLIEDTTKDVQYIPEGLDDTEEDNGLLKKVLGEHDIVNQFSQAESKHKKVISYFNID